MTHAVPFRNKADALNRSLIDARRERVAYFTLRERLSQYEIADKLAEEGFVNPLTGKPFSKSVVNRDIKALRQMWRQEALSDVGIWRGRIMKKLEMLEKQAWDKEDLRLVREIIRDLRALLGTDAPLRADITTAGEPLTAEAMEAIKKKRWAEAAPAISAAGDNGKVLKEA